MQRRGALLGCLALAVAVAFAVGRVFTQTRLDKPAEAQRAGEFVGIETCARCHPREAADHAASGHSRTFARGIDSAAARRWDAKTFEDPERKYEYHYRFGPDGLSVTIPARFGDTSFPLDYAFGSGTHAVSFLTLVPNRDGGTDGVEHRVSSFGRDGHLALTPGHRGEEPRQKIEEFGLVHLSASGELGRCVECHTTSGTVEGPRIENLIANVTCESCHGPGEAHVRRQERGGAGSEPQQIASHWPAPQQLEMCGRCHRRTDWLSKPPDRHDYKIVRFQPVGLSQSRCYQKSDGRLSCTTCHDPHRPPASDTPHYDRKCLDCHVKDRKSAKSCPHRRPEGCVSCHMPPIEVHSGFVFSDHWIRVRAADDLPVYSKQKTEQSRPAQQDEPNGGNDP